MTAMPPFVGAKVVSMTSSGSEEDHDAVSIPLLGTARWTGTTWEVVKTDAKGTHEQFGGQQAHNQDPELDRQEDLRPGQAGLDRGDHLQPLDGQGRGKQEEGYQAQVKVSGDSGEYNRQELGKMFMGVPHKGTAKASGEWTLTATVSPDVVRELEKNSKEMRAGARRRKTRCASTRAS